MVCSLVAALLLVRRFGLLGAATSFSLGSAVRVVTICAFTSWLLCSPAMADTGPSRHGPVTPGLHTSPMVVVDSTTETVV